MSNQHGYVTPNKVKKVCPVCGKDVKWIGVSPTNGDVYICKKHMSVTPIIMEESLGGESVTKCAGCGKEMDGRTDKKTCSPACRKRVSRMKKVKGI